MARGGSVLMSPRKTRGKSPVPRKRTPRSSPSPRALSPPASRTRSRIQIEEDQQYHPDTLREKLEYERATNQVLRSEIQSLKHKNRHLRQRLKAMHCILDMEPQEAATRPLASPGSRRRKRDIARPYVEKGLMSGTIYMLGEAISCGLFYHPQLGRGIYLDAFFHYSVLHSTLIGMFANGPLLHMFFEVVDYLVCFESNLANIVCKVFLDQVVWGCIWNFSYIFLMNLATDSPGFGYIGEGLGLDLHHDLAKGFLSAFKKAIYWKVHVELLQQGLKMLPMDIICYSVIPLRLRALWTACVDVSWVTILSRYD
uniref:Uncharacterized protein n=1 Tax=Hanusia phi TaxID=3032 RepID=A0A7S0I0I6_9CRYP|mmetsp:Transcript_7488/g.17033  ORF Transcript_7488/g.17033 Transcript_7488/m.17033 type:complete len:312 (+) Transcript_7488:66-1001(+)